MDYGDNFGESGDPAETRRRYRMPPGGIKKIPETLKRLYEGDATDLLDKINSFAKLKDFEIYYYNTYRDEPLHHAIRCSNIDVAKTLILRGADPNKEDGYSHTPLYYALEADNEAMVSLLLSNNVSATDVFNEYMVDIPMYYFEYVCKYSNTKIVELFLNNGCTANDCLFTSHMYSCERKSRPLHAAIMNRKIETVKILINYGADVNQTNYLNETPLHLACMGGLTDIIVILLKNNALVNAIAFHNKTPLYYAIRSCDPHIVKLLLDNGAVIGNEDPYMVRNIGNSLLMAIRNGAVEIIKYLLDAGLNLDSHTENFLEFALKCGKSEIVELLIKYGADIYTGDDVGCTLLHIAASMNKIEIMKTLLDRDAYLKDSVQKSLINVKDRYDGTALQVACLMKSHDCIQLLIDYGADPTVANVKGDTALHLAAESDCVKVVQLLVNAKVPINVVNEDLNSPLHIAVMNNSAEIVECLLKNQAATACENKDRLIPLEVAFKHDGFRADIVVISHLLQYAQDINDSYHRRAFCMAMNEIIEKKLAIKVLNLFFKYGFTLNPKNDDINLLLYIAARKGHTTIVQMLLNLGADPNTKVNMESVLHVAMKKRHAETVCILLEHGADAEATNVENELALHNAIDNRDSQSFAALIHTVDAKTLPALLQYVVSKLPNNYTEFIRTLVERGVDVNACYAGSNILLELINKFCTAMSSEVKSINERMLWEYGMDLTARQMNDPTPMFGHVTEMYRCFAGMEVLLSYGADMHTRDSHGSMALEFLLTRVRNSESSGIVPLSHVMKMCNMHVTKLRIAGHYVHPKILEQVEQLSLDNVEDQCLKEVEMLKLLKLNAYTSVYNLLTRNLTEVARLTADFRKRVNEEMRSGTYPLYANYLISKLARADICDLYLSQADDTLRRMHETVLPDICIAKITKYLDIEDVINLAKCDED